MNRQRRPAALLAVPTAALLAAAISAGCASTNALKAPRRGTTQEGLASWYGGQFHGRATASGEIYDMHRISAAHKQLPFGTVVEVVNKDNGRKLRVPINDRGPFVRGRIIDLSLAAARQLDLFGSGVARVRIRVVRTAPGERKLPISYPARGGPRERQATRRASRTRPAERTSGSRRNERIGFTIQAGAFRQRSSAVELARRLRNELELDRVKVRQKGGWYRVQIDRRRRKAAEVVRQKLQEAGIAAIVLR